MTIAVLIKKTFIGAGSQFRDLVHYLHGSMHADMLLERPRGLHLDLDLAGSRRLPHCAWLEHI